MIDPISCLSIATAIAQFIDFGAEVVRTAREIRHTNGDLKDVNALQQKAFQFKELCKDLSKAANGKSGAGQPGDHGLSDVLDQCVKISDDVLTTVDRFHGQDGSSKTCNLKKAFKLHFKAAEFERWERRMTATKVDLCTHLMKAIGAHPHSSPPIKTAADKLTRPKGAQQSGIFGLLEKLEERAITMQESLVLNLESWKVDLEACKPSTRKQDIRPVVNTVNCLYQKVKNAKKAQMILSSFRFDAMRAREHEVKEAHTETFKWILSEGADFSRWLSYNSGLFWISGKAGSGKSTLMKWLFESINVKRRLEAWAEDKHLVVSRHFFWNPGTRMQKSYRGLLQSLCYDIFTACPQLLPLVCKEKWSSLDFSSRVDPFYDMDRGWRESELAELLRRVGTTGTQSGDPNLRLCFFIDGLDEYHGEHGQLIEAILDLSKLPNFKICASSRPWNVFQESFASVSGDRRMLTLQDLTQRDIAAYVQDRLERDKRFVKMLENDLRCSAFVPEITMKAEGVFLWVVLVVNELSKSLTNHDDFSTLQRRLSRIPPGLEDYFRYMFDHLDSFYGTETAQTLLAVVESQNALPIVSLAVIFSTESLAECLVKHRKLCPNIAISDS